MSESDKSRVAVIVERAVKWECIVQGERAVKSESIVPQERADLAEKYRDLLSVN